MRDFAEDQTLVMAQRLGAEQVSEAADIIAQRVKAILAAKATAKRSWEKKQAIELLGGSGSVVPQSEITRTGVGQAWQGVPLPRP